jgi:hypothetical protein
LSASFPSKVGPAMKLLVVLFSNSEIRPDGRNMFSLRFKGRSGAALRGCISPQSLGPVFVLTMGAIDPTKPLRLVHCDGDILGSSAANGDHYGVLWCVRAR